LPLPCYAYVTNVDNGKTVLVRVNDRGPYVNDRLIDMSYAAAKQLGYVGKGRARVRVRYAGLAPLNGDDSRERQFLASQQGFPQGPGRSPPPPTRQYASADDRAPDLPSEASDQWDPNAYRASLAGKSAPPPPAPARRPQPFVQTASIVEPELGRGRMSLTAPPKAYPESNPEPDNTPYEEQPFAPAQRAADNGDAYQAQPISASATADIASYSGRAYVQVGIFRDRSNAERLRRELGNLGPVEVAPMQGGNGDTVYRVRVGPFTQQNAARAQSRIATYGVANTAIVAD
jgi:rare lipoprotein A